MTPLNPDIPLIALIDRVALADEKALRELYELTSSKLYGVAVRVVTNRDWAEDVLQEAFINIWRIAGDYKSTLSPPMAWLALVIHFETSSVLFREAPIHLVQTPRNWPPLHPSVHKKSPNSNPVKGIHYPENRMIHVGSNNVDLGKPADFPSFGWDVAYGERRVDVPDFQASEFMITNGEMWEFVSDGGYRNEEYWCEDGWSWRKHRNLKWPFFWETAGPAVSSKMILHLQHKNPLISLSNLTFVTGITSI